MKATRYNKSEIMKEAHYWKNVLGYTMSKALGMAWRNAKAVIAKKEAVISKNRELAEISAKVQKETRSYNMNYLANTLANYYSNNRYNGD